MQREEQEPMLDDGEDFNDIFGTEKLSRPGRSPADLRRNLRISAYINVFLFAFSVLLSTVVFSLSRTKIANGKSEIANPYSPANSAIEYTYQTRARNDTRFTGYPGEAWDQSMHELLSGTLIRISEDELKQDGSTSLPLKDGGFAAGLGVAHNLHCVKKLKQLMYREHFYPDFDVDGPELGRIREHADHCLEFLRQSVLCQGDYLLYPLHWDAEKQMLLHKYPAAEKCVNYEKLHSWMQSRAVSSDMLDKSATAG